MKKRLYGSIKDLKLICRNSTCDFYELELYILYDNEPIYKRVEKGFLYYSKKEIYKILKDDIIDYFKNLGIDTY